MGSRESVLDMRARIAALAEAEPALADDLALRGALIEIVGYAEVDVPELRLPADLVRARLGGGVPLLDRLDLPVPPSASAVLERLTVAMLADPAAREPAEALLAALRSHRLHAEQLVGEAVVGHQDHLSALAASADVPSSVVISGADLAARTLLAAVARRLRPALALASWTRGWCPICGGAPLLGVGPPSRLRCGRCATAWAHALQECPDCPMGRLAMLDTAPLDGWTLAACDTCQAYLKVAPAPRSDLLADLLVDDLATWPLDRLALARGLTRRTATGYRLEHGEPPGSELDDD